MEEDALSDLIEFVSVMFLMKSALHFVQTILLINDALPEIEFYYAKCLYEE